MSYDPSLRALRLGHLHSQPDEGYSEDIHSQAGSELEDFTTKPLSDSAKVLLRSLDTLGLDERIAVLRLATDSFSQADQLLLLKDILFNLPTWAKQDIASHLDSLMFFDPVEYFPYEIVQTVFSHLSPRDLLNASAVNRTWRSHTQDEELWRVCFKREGWQVDPARIQVLEASGRHDSTSLHRRDSRKRRRAEAFELSPERVESDDVMDGVEDTSSVRSISASPNTPKSKGRRRYSTQSTLSSHSSSLGTGFRLRPVLMQNDGTGDARVSWAYLYKQRRMLERNWERGKYQQFRLPHPKYPDEGHAECVYTIQHIGSILVSGSRDRTIRRWDLDTCRLKGEPLKGHAASVLCLQFDPSPGNDLIVSGGSDSWVIIWRYSTGEIIKKMTTAHTESVLNLRFDDRYIVTCSKDKTIKIWNRRALTKDDPMFPSHVISQYGGSSTAGAPLIEEYSLLTQLLGHHAAVNAVMIHADRIVSASGDRHIKAWSIQSGKCERTYTGHTKGIACVQYDGRRIISGSSDNTVRIFDAEQQAEVACLQGHSNLVRTVQARFGDLQVTSDDELLHETRQADAKWKKAMELGASPASGSRRSLRNAGSSRPEDMLTIGAKIPPGGGGTKWARIVSGSYDETVIVWRKDDDGKWVAKHKLHQEMLRQRSRVARIDHPHAPGFVRFLPQLAPNTAQQAALDVSRLNTTSVQTTVIAGPATVPQVHHHFLSPQTTDQPINPPLPYVTADTTAPDPATLVRPRPLGNEQATAAHEQMVRHPDAARLDSNRIFKLQFDVRRIVCCSQNKVIMGWDFAAGNEELGRVGNLCEETY